MKKVKDDLKEKEGADDGRGKNNSGNDRDDRTGNVDDGNGIGQSGSESGPSGDGSGEGRGKSGDSRDSSDPSGNGGGPSQGSVGKSPRDNLLDTIRAKRIEREHQSSSTTHRTDSDDSEGKRVDSGTDGDGTTGDTGPQPRTNRNARRSGAPRRDSDGGSRQIAQGTNDQERIKEKPQGLLIQGVDKFKRAAPPAMRFRWDDKPLSASEAKDLEPKVKGMLSFIFRYTDKGISVTNRERAKAEIWQDIDDEDLDIIATHLVDMAKASRVVATAVRKLSNSYRLLQIGLITTPRFIQTAQFYSQHGGFSLMPAADRIGRNKA